MAATSCHAYMDHPCVSYVAGIETILILSPFALDDNEGQAIPEKEEKKKKNALGTQVRPGEKSDC